LLAIVERVIVDTVTDLMIGKSLVDLSGDGWLMGLIVDNLSTERIGDWSRSWRLETGDFEVGTVCDRLPCANLTRAFLLNWSAVMPKFHAISKCREIQWKENSVFMDLKK
jgi:hypothetical protein